LTYDITSNLLVDRGYIHICFSSLQSACHTPEFYKLIEVMFMLFVVFCKIYFISLKLRHMVHWFSLAQHLVAHPKELLSWT